MLKIEQFVEQNFNIRLTKAQLEVIAIIAAGSEKEVLAKPRGIGTTTAYKAALAYLQDGLTELKLTEMDGVKKCHK